MIRFALLLLATCACLVGPAFADEAPDPETKSMMMFR